MKILIPIVEKSGKDSKISSHFGRAPFFALYESENNSLKIIENKSHHFGGKERPVEIVLRCKPDIVFVMGIGPRAVDMLRSHGIKIKTGNYDTVKKIIENKDELKELEDVCEEHRHPD